jgi:hypothetical protein
MVASWPFKGITHGKGTMGTRREPVGIYLRLLTRLKSQQKRKKKRTVPPPSRIIFLASLLTLTCPDTFLSAR